MTTALTQNVKASQVAKERPSLEFDVRCYKIGAVLVADPIEEYNPPRLPSDAKGTVGNERLKEFAKRHQPPQKWYDGEEENLF
jgi:hypothetical protein